MAEGGVPDVETQKTFIANQLQKPLTKDDIWYVIDVKWFKQWKSYVGYEAWDHYNVGEESANPGPIDNTPIYTDEGRKLKEHLIDDLDYTLIPEEGWHKLHSWYGMAEGQEPLPRKVIEEGVYTKSLKVEIYPWYMKICENSKPDEQITKQFSRSDTIGMFNNKNLVRIRDVYGMDKFIERPTFEDLYQMNFYNFRCMKQLEKTMREEFSISADKEVRLWNRYMTNMYEPLNKKENTLQDAGLYQGQVIVIEQKNEDDTWPRTLPTKTPVVTSSTASGSSSLSTRSGNTYGSSSGYGGSYSGYGYEPGRGNVTPGLCGLSNIGNTCFMNSALQCMSNVPKLTEYFLSNRWAEEINEDNPLGMHGEIAKSYAELIQTIWSGKYGYTVPRNFKYAVGRFAPQFSGYQQQDSQELMAFLLDGLHEDLNRIKKKPYIELKDAENRSDEAVAKEAWDAYKLRNDSIITDIFHGLLKSTVQCPECNKISVTFDPFCYLSLPLPVKKERQLEVFWLPLDPTKKPVQFKLTVPKMGGVSDLCEALSALVDVSKDKMVVTDVYNHRFHKVFAMTEAISQIMDRDDIFVYEVPVTSNEDPDQVILPVYLREERGKSSFNQQYIGTYQLFGQPMLLPVPRNNCTYEQLYNLVLQRLGRFMSVPADCERWWVTENGTGEDQDLASDDIEDNNSATITSSDATTDTTTHNGHGHDNGSNEDSGMEISTGESTNSEVSPDDDNHTNKFAEMNGQTDNGIECTTPPRLFRFSLVNSYGTAEMESKLKDDGKPLKLSSRNYMSVDWSSLAKRKFYNDSAAESFDQDESMKNKPHKKQVIQLNDCLELFTTTEKLGENDPWYCPACKKHQQATKKFDLWSLPDTLIIHLKRFSYNRYWRDKIDTLIEFPTDGIDLDKYVIDPNRGQMSYELMSVCNHYGGLGGGHYTAYCRNNEEGNWYYFDDSSVSESSPSASVTKAAYVLVYQRKGTLPVTPRGSQPSATATSCDSDEGIDCQNQKTGEDMDTN